MARVVGAIGASQISLIQARMRNARITSERAIDQRYGSGSSGGGPSRGGQSSGGGQFSALLKAEKSAQRANKKRYRQGLRTLRSGYASARKQARRFGRSALQDIEESALQQTAAGEQDLTSRGLGGTTIRGAMTRGIERERVRGRVRVGERKSMLLGQLAMQRAQDISGWMERRSDVGPNLGMFANLIQSAQQDESSDGGSGGYGGGGAVIRRMGPMASRGMTVFGKRFKYGR